MKHGFVVAVVMFLASTGFSLSQTSETSPEQPIPFSHKIHAGDAKLPCKMCHDNPNPGEIMTIANAAQCMQCHSAVKTDSLAVQKLAAFAKDERKVRWARIYQLPAFVNFSHREHTEAKVTCQDCHGPVAQRPQLYQEVDLSMGGCMSCHITRKAAMNCTSCHDRTR